MTYKQIEQAREIRLWIGQIAIPAIGIAVAVPEVRSRIVESVKNGKAKIQSKMLQKKRKS